MTWPETEPETKTEKASTLASAGASAELPSVVIVGRPNVGKSTLFNRLTGRRRSIVTDEPGITRDRIYGRTSWRGRAFEVVDTGGMIPEDRAAIPREILRQADVAISGARELVLVVDARAGVTPLDAELARRLRRTGKPLVIAANKVDTAAGALMAAAFYEFGADVFPVSAEHGTGVDDLLDAVTRDFPAAPPEDAAGGAERGAEDAEEFAAAALGDSAEATQPAGLAEDQAREVQVAIIGRPNVGKSTLLNRLAGAERSIVSAEPGTTRDAVDTEVVRDQRSYRFIDTAGIRRKGKTKLLAEKLSVVMARKHLERADVALLIADASVGITGGDATIAGYAHESGRSVIIVMNKWDLAIEAAQRAAEEAAKAPREPAERKNAKQGKKAHAGKGQARTQAATNPAPTAAKAGKVPQITSTRLAAEYEPLVRERLKFLSYAPIVFITARDGRGIEQLYSAIDHVARARRRRISTGELNRWLAGVDLTRGTSPSSRRVKIYYVTQASSSPPTFILFTNQRKRLHFSYERFLEKRLREKFDFLGSPIRFLERVRERDRNRERARGGG